MDGSFHGLNQWPLGSELITQKATWDLGRAASLLSGFLSFRLAWLIFHSFILKLFKGPVISFSSLFLTFILMRCAMGLGVYPPAVRRRTKAAGDSSTAASPRTSSSPGKLSFQLSSSCTSFLFIYCAYALCRSPPRSVHSQRVSIVWIDLGRLGFVAALIVIAQFSGKLDSGSTAIRPSMGLSYRAVEFEVLLNFWKPPAVFRSPNLLALFCIMWLSAPIYASNLVSFHLILVLWCV